MSPPPKAGIRSQLPGATRPASSASTNATGTVAALMFPYFCTVSITFSIGMPACFATPSIIRRFA